MSDEEQVRAQQDQADNLVAALTKLAANDAAHRENARILLKGLQECANSILALQERQEELIKGLTLEIEVNKGNMQRLATVEKGLERLGVGRIEKPGKGAN